MAGRHHQQQAKSSEIRARRARGVGQALKYVHHVLFADPRKRLGFPGQQRDGAKLLEALRVGAPEISRVNLPPRLSHSS